MNAPVHIPILLRQLPHRHTVIQGFHFAALSAPVIYIQQKWGCTPTCIRGRGRGRNPVPTPSPPHRRHCVAPATAFPVHTGCLAAALARFTMRRTVKTGPRRWDPPLGSTFSSQRFWSSSRHLSPCSKERELLFLVVVV